jgi:hypothetical protein
VRLSASWRYTLMNLNTAMQLGPMLARVLILEHIVFHLPPANPSLDVSPFMIRVEIVVDSEVVWESDEAGDVTWDVGVFQAKAVDQFICGDVQVCSVVKEKYCLSLPGGWNRCRFACMAWT